MKPDFLNVDLDVLSRSTLLPLVERMTEKALVLTAHKDRGGHFLRVELNDAPDSSLEKKLRSFCRLIENLPVAATEVWQKVRSRELNIGLCSGDEGPPLALDISPETLSRVAKLNARIAITLYPKSKEDASHVDSH